MVPEQRDAVQEDFDADTTRIIVATKAFGMGINKPNIAWVVHYDLPDSLDGYAQEAGRAARAARHRRRLPPALHGQDIARRRSLYAQNQRRTRRSHSDCSPRCGTAPNAATVVSSTRMRWPRSLTSKTTKLNVLLAQLESVGALKLGLDCSARGTVDVGFREPANEDERHLFRELFYKAIRARPNVRIQLDFTSSSDEHGTTRTCLEQQFIDWSLDRFVTFSSSRRMRRVRLLARRLPARALRREAERWKRWQERRLQAMIDYAEHQAVAVAS